jgi:hypothetical protein
MHVFCRFSKKLSVRLVTIGRANEVPVDAKDAKAELVAAAVR